MGECYFGGTATSCIAMVAWAEALYPKRESTYAEEVRETLVYPVHRVVSDEHLFGSRYALACHSRARDPNAGDHGVHLRRDGDAVDGGDHSLS